jgi:hypothetical protein
MLKSMPAANDKAIAASLEPDSGERSQSVEYDGFIIRKELLLRHVHACDVSQEPVYGRHCLAIVTRVTSVTSHSARIWRLRVPRKV